MKQIKITCVAGARPNFVKIAALVNELASRPRFSCQLIHTGQHRSREMSENFFRDLCITTPDLTLNAVGQTSTQQIGSMMQLLEGALSARSPDIVLVVGDVNSTVAAALAAAHLNIQVAHVEAGLRSFDRSMPEEINRIVTDSVSSFLFTTEDSADQNLLREGVPRERIFNCGNVMIDTLFRFRKAAMQSGVLSDLYLTRGTYAVVTLHRPSNVDDPPRLHSLMTLLEDLSALLPVVFPVHPRTSQRLAELGTWGSKIKIIPALGYLDFVHLMSCARMVLTDSGGIQEETTALGVPCLTIRENTERPVTLTQGTNLLVGTDPHRVFQAASELLRGFPRQSTLPERWDGFASKRIVDVLDTKLGGGTC